MALSEYKHHTSRGQRMDRAGGWVRDEVHGQVPEDPQAACRRDAALGFLPSLGRRNGSSGTPWSTLSTLCVWLPWCRSSMPSAQMVDQFAGHHALLRLASACSRAGHRSAPMRAVLRDPQWWNSWWKCRLVSPSLPVDAKEAGRTWFQVSGPRDRWWWLSGSRHTQCDHPEVYTARPGPYKNTGLG